MFVAHVQFKNEAERVAGWNEADAADRPYPLLVTGGEVELETLRPRLDLRLLVGADDQVARMEERPLP